MSLYVIASLIEFVGARSVLCGYKIYNSTTGQYKLLSEKSIREKLINKGYKIENAEFKGNHLVGKGGSLDRYTSLDVSTGEPVNNVSAVILGVDPYHEYHVVLNPESEVVETYKLSPYQLRKHAWQNRDNKVVYANARVSKDVDNFDKVFVRPISGKFTLIPKTYNYLEKEFDYSLNGWHTWFIRVVKPNETSVSGKNDMNESIVEVFTRDGNKEKFPLGQLLGIYNINTFIDKLSEDGNFLIKNFNDNSFYFNKDIKNDVYVWLSGNKDLLS